jgi:hypothetical protein
MGVLCLVAWWLAISDTKGTHELLQASQEDSSTHPPPNHISICNGRDSSVGMVTRYGLDGPGIKSRWEARISAPDRSGPGAHPASYKKDTGYFPGAKRPGRGADHPPTHRAEVKQRVEIHGAFGKSLCT